MKSYDVTIQMKALCLYFLMMLFAVCQNFRKRNLPLATFGSERVKDLDSANQLDIVEN